MLLSSILAFCLLLLLSAFFSGSETAFFSLSRLRLKELEEDGHSSARRIVALMGKSQRLLITVLIGNTLVNTGAATLAALLAHDLGSRGVVPLRWALAGEVLMVTLILLIFAEVTPKVFAIRNGESWARMAALPLQFFQWVLLPLVWPVEQLTRVLQRHMHGHESLHLSHEELRTLVEVGEDEGVLEEDEKRMIHQIMEFGETTVKEVMVPRIDMACLPHDSSVDEAIEVIRSEGHSRVPIYRERVDNVVGILYAKDLLHALQGSQRAHALDQLARLPYFVPEGKKIEELLHEFQTGRIHMAIVVDEYGGTAGLVTLEDILEEIVGEIQDEFDSEAPLHRQATDGSWIIDSSLSPEEANELLGEEILPTEEDYETLGGFIYKLAGEVPKASMSFDHLGWRFTVMTMKRHRIGLVKAKRQGVTLEASGKRNQD